MSALRSAGWSVRPSFAPHGPTDHVTLLADDDGLTQLAGMPTVAWQTPWSEVTDLELVRVRTGMALFATIAGVRYCWRTRSLDDFEAWRDVVLVRGGAVARRARRVGVLSLIVVVLLASFAGAIAAFFSGTSAANQELADARAVNLTLKDLPSGWTTTSASALGYLFGSANQVVTSTTAPSTTTTLSPTSIWVKASSQFQRCMNVTAAADRVYGRAGQMPDYQVSSKYFTSPSSAFIQVASITQYYATTTMVRRDKAEMSSPKFGGCFVASNASLLLSASSGATSTVATGERWQPSTFVSGWSRGGVVLLARSATISSLHLVMVVVASGHYEVTMGALVSSWPGSKFFLNGLVNTLLSRVTSTSSSAV